MTKEEALKVWEHEFGNKDYAYDFTGRKIKREDYNVDNQVGWQVSFMKPLKSGGKDYDGNIVIAHLHTISEKGDDYPEFYVDSVKYHVLYDKDGDFYYIESLDIREDEEE